MVCGKSVCCRAASIWAVRLLQVVGAGAYTCKFNTLVADAITVSTDASLPQIEMASDQGEGEKAAAGVVYGR
jgi:hypothetical protein